MSSYIHREYYHHEGADDDHDHHHHRGGSGDLEAVADDVDDDDDDVDLAHHYRHHQHHQHQHHQHAPAYFVYGANTCGMTPSSTTISSAPLASTSPAPSTTTATNVPPAFAVTSIHHSPIAPAHSSATTATTTISPTMCSSIVVISDRAPHHDQYALDDQAERRDLHLLAQHAHSFSVRSSSQLSPSPPPPQPTTVNTLVAPHPGALHDRFPVAPILMQSSPPPPLSPADPRVASSGPLRVYLVDDDGADFDDDDDDSDSDSDDEVHDKDNAAAVNIAELIEQRMRRDSVHQQQRQQQHQQQHFDHVMMSLSTGTTTPRQLPPSDSMRMSSGTRASDASPLADSSIYHSRQSVVSLSEYDPTVDVEECERTDMDGGGAAYPPSSRLHSDDTASPPTQSPPGRDSFGSDCRPYGDSVPSYGPSDESDASNRESFTVHHRHYVCAADAEVAAAASTSAVVNPLPMTLPITTQSPHQSAETDVQLMHSGASSLSAYSLVSSIEASPLALPITSKTTSPLVTAMARSSSDSSVTALLSLIGDPHTAAANASLLPATAHMRQQSDGSADLLFDMDLSRGSSSSIGDSTHRLCNPLLYGRRSSLVPLVRSTTPDTRLVSHMRHSTGFHPFHAQTQHAQAQAQAHMQLQVPAFLDPRFSQTTAANAYQQELQHMQHMQPVQPLQLVSAAPLDRCSSHPSHVAPATTAAATATATATATTTTSTNTAATTSAAAAQCQSTHLVVTARHDHGLVGASRASTVMHTSNTNTACVTPLSGVHAYGGAGPAAGSKRDAVPYVYSQPQHYAQLHAQPYAQNQQQQQHQQLYHPQAAYYAQQQPFVYGATHSKVASPLSSPTYRASRASPFHGPVQYPLAARAHAQAQVPSRQGSPFEPLVFSVPLDLSNASIATAAASDANIPFSACSVFSAADRTLQRRPRTLVAPDQSCIFEMEL